MPDVRNFTGTLMLSVLIPSIPDREEMLSALLAKVAVQIRYCQKTHPSLGDFEILIDDSNGFLEGGPTIGGKRQGLLESAKGLYVCFLDDDEDISPDYLETLLRLCAQDRDVCTFRSFVKVKDFWSLVDMRLGNPNEQLTGDKIVKRSPWHVCPVRKTFAEKYKFPETNYGEDFNWFGKVLTHCFNEAHTDRIIHNYNHGDHSQADKIIKHESGV